jgi:hypothetical protein
MWYVRALQQRGQSLRVSMNSNHSLREDQYNPEQDRYCPYPKQSLSDDFGPYDVPISVFLRLESTDYQVDKRHNCSSQKNRQSNIKWEPQVY